MTLATAKSNCRKLFIYFIFLKIPIPAESSCKPFFYFIHNVKNDGLTDGLMIQCQKSSHGTILLHPSIGFTAITDHPRAGEVPTGSGPQLWAPVRIPILVSVQGHTECRGWRVLNQVSSLALSKWTDGTASLWVNSQNCRALLHT